MASTDERSQSPNKQRRWSKYVTDVYDPVQVGSIDGTDEVPHDRALVRAINSTYRPNGKVKGNPMHTIFIGRLAHSVTEEQLRTKFSPFGTIVHLRLVSDIVTGLPRGYAFIEYGNREEALRAIDRMHGVIIEGKEILVDEEWERRLDGWKPRRLGGGFGGRKKSQQLRFGCKVQPFRRPLLEEVANSGGVSSVSEWNRRVRHRKEGKSSGNR
ncbi:U11/U12 small nuclear ribonucleoprotein 35 kDa protein-like [Anopheles ziemanni]|uniref:U11/U12 small nuclear ribonucleoprotein 35 kDa protein-like n=1 Tax=Anopheles coustani TaxID=139045 RepID=UPI00265902BD|nr:U11/U12 small nuclear ribonucleoprotein 35 kDa protein-like [Anopheles coustani]XP_058173721.1 U11/U12 small nuclear ribonucleoprotein 35 kDa protein-like [Anopheles ziemanni]